MTLSWTKVEREINRLAYWVDADRFSEEHPQDASDALIAIMRADKGESSYYSSMMTDLKRKEIDERLAFEWSEAKMAHMAMKDAK